MKKIVLVFVAGLLLMWGATAQATTLFVDDFESGLDGWTGKNDGPHHGVILPTDPSADNYLAFSVTNSAGDIFTTSTSFASTTGTYTLAFDYMGLQGGGGGFIGYSYGYPDSHTWLAGSYYTPGYTDVVLTDDGEWHHYEITFAASDYIHIMLEDFSATSGGRPLDAFFDNVTLTTDGAAVPLPGAVWLLGSGLMGLLGLRRRR